jgi:hypothetical protein
LTWSSEGSGDFSHPPPIAGGVEGGVSDLDLGEALVGAEFDFGEGDLGGVHGELAELSDDEGVGDGVAEGADSDAEVFEPFVHLGFGEFHVGDDFCDFGVGGDDAVGVGFLEQEVPVGGGEFIVGGEREASRESGEIVAAEDGFSGDEEFEERDGDGLAAEGGGEAESAEDLDVGVGGGEVGVGDFFAVEGAADVGGGVGIAVLSCGEDEDDHEEAADDGEEEFSVFTHEAGHRFKSCVQGLGFWVER